MKLSAEIQQQLVEKFWHRIIVWNLNSVATHKKTSCIFIAHKGNNRTKIVKFKWLNGCSISILQRMSMMPGKFVPRGKSGRYLLEYLEKNRSERSIIEHQTKHYWQKWSLPLIPPPITTTCVVLFAIIRFRSIILYIQIWNWFHSHNVLHKI